MFHRQRERERTGGTHREERDTKARKWVRCRDVEDNSDTLYRATGV